MAYDEPTQPPILESQSTQKVCMAPAFTLAVHPDPSRIGERIVLNHSGKRHYEVCRSAPFFEGMDGRSRPLETSHVSRKPFLVTHEREGLSLSKGNCSSMLEINGTKVTGPVFIGYADIRHGVFLEINRAILLLIHMADSDGGILPDFGLIGNSTSINQVRRDIHLLGDADVTVLIRGASGTGKELVARAVHAQGKRRHKTMVSVNLGAMPRDLGASELFGSVRGAFTGAVQRDGYFLSARGGSLFLDEVAEASGEVQAALLRTLETGEVFPIGSDKPVSIDVRLISASDADLERAIQNNQFKLPLLHRLAGFVIRLAPLVERRDDIPILFRSFAEEFLRDLGSSLAEKHGERPWMSTTLMMRLISHTWPGNVRELRNVVRQLVILNQSKKRLELNFPLEKAEADVLQDGDINALDTDPMPGQETEDGAGEEVETPRKNKPHQISAETLRETLREHHWEPGPTARALGISRSAIYVLFDRYPGFRRAVDVTREELEAALEAHDNDPRRAASALEVSAYALSRYAKKLGLTSS